MTLHDSPQLSSTLLNSTQLYSTLLNSTQLYSTLLNFTQLYLTLLNFSQLSSTYATMHKFCACYSFSLSIYKQDIFMDICVNFLQEFAIHGCAFIVDLLLKKFDIKWHKKIYFLPYRSP